MGVSTSNVFARCCSPQSTLGLSCHGIPTMWHQCAGHCFVARLWDTMTRKNGEAREQSMLLLLQLCFSSFYIVYLSCCLNPRDVTNFCQLPLDTSTWVAKLFVTRPSQFFIANNPDRFQLFTSWTVQPAVAASHLKRVANSHVPQQREDQNTKALTAQRANEEKVQSKLDTVLREALNMGEESVGR